MLATGLLGLGVIPPFVSLSHEADRAQDRLDRALAGYRLAGVLHEQSRHLADYLTVPPDERPGRRRRLAAAEEVATRAGNRWRRGRRGEDPEQAEALERIHVRRQELRKAAESVVALVDGGRQGEARATLAAQVGPLLHESLAPDIRTAAAGDHRVALVLLRELRPAVPLGPVSRRLTEQRLRAEASADGALTMALLQELALRQASGWAQFALTGHPRDERLAAEAAAGFDAALRDLRRRRPGVAPDHRLVDLERAQSRLRSGDVPADVDLLVQITADTGGRERAEAADAVAAVGEEGRRVGVASGAVLLALLTVAVVQQVRASGRLAAAARAVGQVARQVRRGQAPTPVDVASRGDVADLVAAFNVVVERLADSERTLIALLETSPDLVLFLDQDGVIQRAGPGAARLLRRDPSGLVHRQAGEIFHPDDRAPLATLFEAVCQGSQEVRQPLSARLLPMRSQALDAEVTVVDLRTDPHVMSLVLHARDVSERRRVARELTAAERRLAEAQSIAQVGSWEWDVASGDMTWSDELHRIYGLPAGQLCPSFETWLHTVHPDDRERVHGYITHSQRTRQPFHFDHRVVRPDRVERIVETSGIVQPSGDGSTVRLVGTEMDVTASRRSERALRASVGRARSIIETANDAYVETDARGVISAWNRQAEATFGWRREEVIGQPLNETIIPPQYRQAHDEGLRRFRETGEASVLNRTIELSALDRQGREFPVEITIWAVGEGPALTFSAFVRDITERRAVERMKDDFIAVVSHELRTPMTAILGPLKLLASGALGPLSDRAQRMADMAVKNTDRLVRLVNDILDISKVDSGRMTLERRACNAADLVKQAVDVMGPPAEEGGVHLVVEAEPSPIWADPDRILQTLTNLVGNALKFSPPGAQVTVKVAQRGGEVLFSVRDEGPGIPDDKLLTIFERFEQLDASTTRQHGGAGLGLAISHSIVAQHGGRIWAESAAGEGATFWFSLPAHRGTDPGPAPDHAVLASDRPSRPARS